MRLWYYTIQKDLPYLLATGEITPANKTVSQQEKSSVWLSANAVWDNMANRSYQEMDGTYRMGDMKTTYLRYGLVRIEINPEVAVHNWRAYKRLSGIERKELRYLKRLGRQQKAKRRDWRMSFATIPAEHWLSIEVWDWGKQHWRTNDVQPSDLVDCSSKKFLDAESI